MQEGEVGVDAQAQYNDRTSCLPATADTAS